MVRHKQFTNGTGRSGSAKYFTEHLSVSEYYANGVGILQGKAFQYMGMSKREIDLKVFTALEKNLNPETGKKLTPRTNGVRKDWGLNPDTNKLEIQVVDNHRTGMDLPFIVPKTVSEVMAENPGEFADAIEKACIRANQKAMELAESLAKTRVRKGGAQEDRVTGNAVYLGVIHRDARPVGSKVPDPFWHSHNYIFNFTYDPVEERLKAIQLHDVIKHADTIDAVGLSELERGLTALGIGTERTADGRSFEVTSVKGKEIFSKRRNEVIREEKQNRERIETLTKREIRKAALLGKTLDYDRVKTEVRNRLGKAMAQKKVVVSMEEKLEKLREQMTPDIRASLQREAAVSAPRRNWQTPEEAKAEVLYSAFKQYSVVHELDIAGAVLRAAGGSVSFEEALEYARGSGSFIKLDQEGHVTTQAVRLEERRMLQTVRDGRDQHESILKEPEEEIADEKIRNSVDQSKATRFIWKSRDLVSDVSGIAGAGKSSLLRAVVPEIEKDGRETVFLAPTSPSEKNLKADFPEALTLQRFLADPELQHLEPGTVVFLDEVSMVSVPQLCRLVAIVKANQARLVTLGDVDQHASPERGDAIRILQDSGSVRSVELTETYRPQVAYLKEAIVDLKAHRREEGFQKFDSHGDIREVEDIFDLRSQAVELHLEAVREGHVAILASPVHAEAREVAGIVREILKGEEIIGQEDHAIVRLSRLNLEGVELKDPLHYQDGRVVAFHTRVDGGFRAGEKWRVVERQSDGVFKLEREGVTKMFKPASKGKWNVYETSEMLLSVGDQVRITEGFKEFGVAFKNNDVARIAAIDADRVTLDDGRSMKRDFLHLDQGVCITSYASECRTVRQMVAICPLSSFAEMDAKTFYVLASRATHRAVFLTDCKEAFKEAVLRPGERKAVWDYEQGQAPPMKEKVQETIDQQKRQQAIKQEMEESNGIEKEPAVVDLHAGARKRTAEDQARIHAAEMEAARQGQQRAPEQEMGLER